MESWKGNRTPSNPQEGYYVGLMNACGYRTKDLEKPVIGIVNSFTDVNPGHRAFKELVGYVKEGVWAAGGTPAEFNVPAPCDGMAQGEGMHFILPSRDLIAGSIQAMASAHGFDGLVFLCSCDKIVPGMLMAAAALNKPCMFLTAGSMLPYEADEGTYVTPDLKESIGQRNIDAISEETFTRFRENICFSCGTCSMYGTANTMGVFTEVIGLCPIDSTTCSSARPPSTSRRATSASASSRSRRRVCAFPTSSPRRASRTACATSPRPAARRTPSSTSVRSRA